jgi:hypothetical protein
LIPKLSLLLALLSLYSVLAAQTSTSELFGIVRDPSGSVVPGASATLENEKTGVVYKRQTTNAGLYSFPSLPVGAYSLTVEMKGFKTYRRTGIVLQVGSPADVDVAMEVGETSEVVSIEAQAEMLDTTNATIGTVVDQKAIVELPLNGRNPMNLIVLEPGVVQRSSGAAGSGLHVNGSRDRAYNVTIDGIEANESSVPNPISNLYRLTPDNVQEYKITTSNATAEEGRNSGASIAVATRSGGNQLHGTVFWFLRNTALNSNEFFSNARGLNRPDIKMNQYGFELSGPIIRNKTFFFGSWAGQAINFRQPLDQTFGAPTLYTASARQGIYRYFRANPNSPFILNGAVITRNSPLLVNSKTGQLVPGVRTCETDTDLNCVASYNFGAADPRKIGPDPTVASLFGSYPAPNNFASGDGLNTASYAWDPPTRVRGPNYMLRLDHNFNQNNMVYARALWGNYNTLEGDPLNGRPEVFPGFPPLGEVFRNTLNIAASYRRVISPSMVNELTAGVARFGFLFTQGEANPTWPNVVPYFFANSSLPYTNTPRSARYLTTYQLLDNFSWIVGRHVMKMGGNIRFYQHNDQRGQPGGVNVTPSTSFSAATRPPQGFDLPPVASSSQPGINSTDLSLLQGAINDVLGIPARLSQVFLGDLNSDTYMPFMTGNSVTLWAEGQRLKQYNFYFQDDWKVLSNLTISYGLRWEINTPATESHDRVYVPDKSITGSEGPVAFVKAKGWWQRENLNLLGPRLGIAWTPDAQQKTVIRAGFGIAYDTISSFQVTAAAGRVPGLTLACSSTVTGTTTPGCERAPDLRISEGFPNQMAAPTRKPSEFLKPPLQLLSNAPALTLFDQNIGLPTVYQWNINIQRELPRGVIVQAGYVARRGTHLFRAYDLNQINASPILPSFLIMQQNVKAGCKADGSGCSGGGTGQQVPLVTQGIVSNAFVNSSTTATDLAQNGAGNFAGRIEQTTLAAKLRPNQQFGTITYLDSGGDSIYNSLQIAAQKSFSAGLLLQASYTFGKSIDNQSVDPVGASSGGGLSTTNSRTPTDISNWHNERGRSDFDRTQVFTASGVYELPFGKGKPLAGDVPRWLNTLVGGWSVNGILTAMTGEPFSVTSGVRTSNFSHVSRAALTTGVTPQVRLVEKANVTGPVVFASSLGFGIPAPGDNGLGRNVFTAPSYFNLDMGLTKNFTITERWTMQFRAEAFNALNHPNFDNPRDSTVGSPSILSTNFGQTCCATVAPPSTQAIIQTGESARIIQFALKLMF